MDERSFLLYLSASFIAIASSVAFLLTVLARIRASLFEKSVNQTPEREWRFFGKRSLSHEGFELWRVLTPPLLPWQKKRAFIEDESRDRVADEVGNRCVVKKFGQELRLERGFENKVHFIGSIEKNAFVEPIVMGSQVVGLDAIGPGAIGPEAVDSLRVYWGERCFDWRAGELLENGKVLARAWKPRFAYGKTLCAFHPALNLDLRLFVLTLVRGHLAHHLETPGKLR
jgi:hypothetical protein